MHESCYVFFGYYFSKYHYSNPQKLLKVFSEAFLTEKVTNNTGYIVYNLPNLYFSEPLIDGENQFKVWESMNICRFFLHLHS